MENLTFGHLILGVGCLGVMGVLLIVAIIAIIAWIPKSNWKRSGKQCPNCQSFETEDKGSCILGTIGVIWAMFWMLIGGLLGVTGLLPVGLVFMAIGIVPLILLLALGALQDRYKCHNCGCAFTYQRWFDSLPYSEQQRILEEEKRKIIHERLEYEEKMKSRNPYWDPNDPT